MTREGHHRMAKETLYMAHAMNLLPQPAALYEWPSLRFVSWNEAAQVAGQQLPERRGTQPEMSWVGLTNEEVVVAVQGAHNRHWVYEHDVGEIHFSICDPLPSHTRPPLLLTSVHHDGNAELEHARIRTALLTNEGVEVAEAQLTTSLQVVASTVEAIREVGRIVNTNLSRAAELEAQYSREKDSPST